MERQINKQLVRHAVVRQIFCPSCNQVLDTHDSHLIERGSNITILCGSCWHRTIAKGLHGTGTLTVTHGVDGQQVEVELTQPPSQAQPEQSEADISGEQVSLW